MKSIVALLIAASLISTPIYAGTYWVSNTGAATWANAESETALSGAACTDAVTAFANADDDDVVYFRGGTYDVATILGTEATYVYDSARLVPANSGSSGHPITFKAYTGETPILNDTCADGTTRVFVIGAPNRDYIVIDGFKVQANNGNACGTISLMGGDAGSGLHYGNVVRNCEVDGWGGQTDGEQQYDGIRIQEQDGALIEYNTIYDMGIGDANWACLKIYHVQNIIVQNNEFYNSHVGIYDKSWSTNCTYRYNYIHDCSQGIRTDASASPYQSGNEYYHNVVANSTSKSWFSDTAFPGYANFLIYNNTFYSAGVDCQVYIGNTQTNCHFYNNIIHSTTGTVIRILPNATFDEMNYNQFSDHVFSIVLNYGGGGTTYSSLGDWQTASELDANSLASDPQFLNSSGNMNTLADFEIGASCIGTGKNSGNIGADVSLVGVDASEAEPESPAVSNSGCSGNGVSNNGGG